MESALKLPNEQQEDVLALIQSVLTPDSTEVMLTDKIEEVLKASHSRDLIFLLDVLNVGILIT